MEGRKKIGMYEREQAHPIISLRGKKEVLAMLRAFVYTSCVAFIAGQRLKNSYVLQQHAAPLNLLYRAGLPLQRQII